MFERCTYLFLVLLVAHGEIVSFEPAVAQTAAGRRAACYQLAGKIRI